MRGAYSDFVAHIITCAENKNIQHPFPGSTDLCEQAAQSLQIERHKNALIEIQEITDWEVNQRSVQVQAVGAA